MKYVPKPLNLKIIDRKKSPNVAWPKIISNIFFISDASNITIPKGRICLAHKAPNPKEYESNLDEGILV